MTKFIFISDTHVGGAGHMSYTQQKSYVDKIETILRCLDNWIKEEGDIDFILHGGDMINDTATDINLAHDLFNLSVPVYLCLGNHDLTVENGFELWLKNAPEFFLNKSPNFTIHSDNTLIHVIPNQWEVDKPYFWKRSLIPYYLPNQFETMHQKLREYPECIHFISTHTSILGIPSSQTGLHFPYFESGQLFTQQIMEILEKSPQIRGVFHGHTHLNAHINKNNVHFISASAFPESPFEYKVIEVTSSFLSMKTYNLIDKVDFKVEYNFNKTFVQGRSIDRGFIDDLKRGKPLLTVDSKIDNLLANKKARAILNNHAKFLIDLPILSHFLRTTVRTMTFYFPEQITPELLKTINAKLEEI